MPNFYTDNEDLRFYVERYLDWAPLVELTEFHHRAEGAFTSTAEALDFYQSVLEMLGEFAANEIAPHSKALDTEHPVLQDGDVHFPPAMQRIFDQIKALELHGMCVPRDLGGMNMPFVLFMLGSELLARADVSVAAHNGFHGGIAMAMLLFSTTEGSTEFDREHARITKTRWQQEIGEIITGEAWGSMDITEPGAGSDMAAMRTKGVLGADGVWRVTGEKIFITSGHAKYHFVIARTEETDASDAYAGLKGLSMFLVPTYTDHADGTRTHHATFARLEEKLGHHGSATVGISYDESPAQLVGQRGEGFKYMLQLMNNARVAVGFESLGILEGAHRMATAYAAERRSMGKTIDHHEMIAEYLEDMRTDLQAVRALAVAGAYHEEMAQKLNRLLRFLPPADETERKRTERLLRKHQARSRFLTPLLKYLGSEKAVEHARRCIQIHGGFGYSEEYGAEKLLRDAMVLPIYEGTSQIQSLMAMKDNLMGILKDPKGFVQESARAVWLSRSARDPLERRVARLKVRVHKVLQLLMSRLAGKKLHEMRRLPVGEWKQFFSQWDPKKDFALAMLHAERLTRMLCDLAVCEELAAQAQRFPERAEVLERYLEKAEPRSRYLYEEITTTGTRLLTTLAQAGESEARVG